MSRLVVVSFVAALAFSLVACNTVEGAGKDVKAAGAAVEKSAK